MLLNGLRIGDQNISIVYETIRRIGTQLNLNESIY